MVELDGADTFSVHTGAINEPVAHTGERHHTGEISEIDGNFAGIGAHIASSVMDRAPDGAACVSSTVRDLTAGSSIAYRLPGRFRLEGVPGEWVIYEAD